MPSLLDLPAELRLRIYDHIDLFAWRLRSRGCYMSLENTELVNICSTCRLLRFEAMPMLQRKWARISVDDDDIEFEFWCGLRGWRSASESETTDLFGHGAVRSR